MRVVNKATREPLFRCSFTSGALASVPEVRSGGTPEPPALPAVLLAPILLSTLRLVLDCNRLGYTLFSNRCACLGASRPQRVLAHGLTTPKAVDK